MNSILCSSFPSFAKQVKQFTSTRIAALFQENRPIFSNLPGSGDWLAAEMLDFACSGKMLRGALAHVGATLFAEQEETRSEQALSLAASLELLQAGLLAHDDIMDHDETRRGKPTCHIRIRNKIVKEHPNIDVHLAMAAAEAQGICIGDLFFFIAWKEITRTPSHISSLVATEHAAVTLAQMNDVIMGYDKQFPSLDEIINMYRHKTARYTVALPLLAGASLSAPLDMSTAKLIEDFGEALGIIFQLQDDRLGLFGDEASIGKPVGSDIKEGKKTPYILLLQNRMTLEEHDHFNSIYKSSFISDDDIAWLRELIRAKKVDESVQTLVSEYMSTARNCLESLAQIHGVSHSSIHLLENFMEYSSHRDH